DVDTQRFQVLHTVINSDHLTVVKCRTDIRIRCIYMFEYTDLCPALFPEFALQSVNGPLAHFQPAAGKFGKTHPVFLFITDQHLPRLVDQDTINPDIEITHGIPKVTFPGTCFSDPAAYRW